MRRGVARRCSLVAADERQPLARRQLDDVLAQRADPQLRPRQVLQDRDRAARRARPRRARAATVSACSSSVPWE